MHQAPELSQHTVVRGLGSVLIASISVSRELVGACWIKMQSLNQSKNKLRYAYLLTPVGVVVEADCGVFEVEGDRV